MGIWLCFARIKSAFKMNNIQRADVTFVTWPVVTKLHFARHSGEHASDADVLIIGQDTFGASLPAVIDEVVGVPSGAARAHLR